jgi:hypothetical protein
MIDFPRPSAMMLPHRTTMWPHPTMTMTIIEKTDTVGALAHATCQACFRQQRYPLGVAQVRNRESSL